MEHTNGASAGDSAHMSSVPPETDPKNPDLIKVLRAEEILAETARPADANRGTPHHSLVVVDETAVSAPATRAD